MGKRGAAVAQTRQRIVEATLSLHGEKGVAATSWDDIAARAGVGVGTVYRHFPTLDELVPACGEIAMRVVDLPDPADAATLFEQIPEPADRIRRLVREVYALYERAAHILRAIRRDAGVHERLARDHEAIEASLSALVDEALRSLDVTRADRAVVRAMVDLNCWDALRQQGLEPAEAVAAAADMVVCRMTSRVEPPALPLIPP